jgi:hypothetical protein
VDKRCSSQGCTNPVTHHTHLASAEQLPWCCVHFNLIMELKDKMIEINRLLFERAHEELESERRFNGEYMMKIIKKLGLEPVK